MGFNFRNAVRGTLNMDPEFDTETLLADPRRGLPDPARLPQNTLPVLPGAPPNAVGQFPALSLAVPPGGKLYDPTADDGEDPEMERQLAVTSRLRSRLANTPRLTQKDFLAMQGEEGKAYDTQNGVRAQEAETKRLSMEGTAANRKANRDRMEERDADTSERGWKKLNQGDQRIAMGERRMAFDEKFKTALLGDARLRDDVARAATEKRLSQSDLQLLLQKASQMHSNARALGMAEDHAHVGIVNWFRKALTGTTGELEQLRAVGDQGGQADDLADPSPVVLPPADRAPLPAPVSLDASGAIVPPGAQPAVPPAPVRRIGDQNQAQGAQKPAAGDKVAQQIAALKKIAETHPKASVRAEARARAARLEAR